MPGTARSMTPGNQRSRVPKLAPGRGFVKAYCSTRSNELPTPAIPEWRPSLRSPYGVALALKLPYLGRPRQPELPVV